MAALCAHYRRLERKRKRNIESGLRFLKRNGNLHYRTTTLALDQDVVQQVRAVVTRSHRPLQQVINEALRAGLKSMEQPRAGKRYRTGPLPMGLREGLCLDNIHKLLVKAEGERYK